ncbi:MAG: glycosyl hydrolase family 28-related protein [Candidatus Ratteibacteria bacterium]|jgi:hypothetical protein
MRGAVVVAMALFCMAGAVVSPGAEELQVPSSGLFFNVKDFGAQGDGVTDDTGSVQKAIDTVGKSGGTLLFPPGTYQITSVGLIPGVRYLGYGATIRRPAKQGKWVRTFDASKRGYAYRGEVDSLPLVIEGFIFDGNRTEQDEYQKYQLEQAHLIFLSAGRDLPGRLRARVQNCDFKDCVADAISVYSNVDAQIANCTATDCFRGGVVITGGNTRVQLTNFTAGGKVHATGIDVEVDGSGYNGSKSIEFYINGLSLPDGDFDVGIADHSVVVGSNIITKAPFYIYGGGETSEMRFSNCLFGVGEYSSYANRIVSPGNLTFDNCRFMIDGTSSEEKQKSWAAIHVYWRKPGEKQMIKLVNCDFSVGPGIADTDKTYAVYCEAYNKDSTGDDTLIVEGGTISSAFTEGIRLNQGGKAIIRKTHIGAETALLLSSGAAYYLDVVVDSVDVRGSKVFANIPAQSINNRIEFRNVFLDESENVLQTRYGLANNTYVGSRTIFGEEAPSAKMSGIVNDRYRLKKPLPGGVYEWICMVSNPGGKTVWKPLSTIAE